MHTIQVDFTFSASDFASADLTNVYVKYGSSTSSPKATITTAAAGATSANTWSFSETLAKNDSMVFEVYGDIAASATSDATADTVQTALKISGTTANSGASVDTGTSAVAGQVITATSGGTLTIALASSTPLAMQVVAGSTLDYGSTRVKLTAANEDIYVDDVTFRIDTNADDATVASLALYSAEGSGDYAQVGTTKTLITDGTTNPGYVRWVLEGDDRIKVTKDGSSYLSAVPTYVSSGQATVTSLTPAIYLSDIQAQGTSVMHAEDTDGSDLIVETGILIGATPTFAADATATSYTALGATQTMTANAAPTTDRTGSYVLIDVDADATYDDATDEIAYVMEGNTSNTTLTLQRGVLGTTAISDAAGNIYFLAGINGSAMTVLDTKLSLAIASGSPSGATQSGTSKIVFKFNATAEDNAEDPAENKVVLTHVDITTSESSASMSDLKIYPSALDQNSTYVTNCGGLTASKWRCIMSTTGSANEIVEGGTTEFTVRGTTAYSANGSIQVSIATLGSSSSASNDVSWTDNSTTQIWVDQPTSEVSGGLLTSTVASGTVDATAPTISAIAMGNGTTLNSIDANDTITITYSEVIDASTVNAALVPGGSVTGVTTGNGVVTVAQATSIVTVAGVTTFDSGASVAVAVSATTQTLALDATGKILTITVTALTGGGVITTPAAGVGAQIAGVYDVNAVNSGTPATPTPTGAF